MKRDKGYQEKTRRGKGAKETRGALRRVGASAESA